MTCDRCKREGTTYKYVEKNYCSRCISWLYVDAIGEAGALRALSIMVDECLARVTATGCELEGGPEADEESASAQQQKKEKDIERYIREDRIISRI